MGAGRGSLTIPTVKAYQETPLIPEGKQDPITLLSSMITGLAGIAVFFRIYWTGQKVHLGFSIECMEKLIELFGQPNTYRGIFFPDGASSKESACQCRRHKRYGFNPWVRKIPWRRKQQPTPLFFPGEFHGQRSLAGYSPWGHRVRHDLATNTSGGTAAIFKPQRQSHFSRIVKSLKSQDS